MIDDPARLMPDRRQFASVRRIVLDDGPERGASALLFSTGGGLDFMALADRALDLGTLNFRGMPLAWQSPAGFRAAALNNPDRDGGRGFDRSFSGFLMTCGLEHARQPDGPSPLHGGLLGAPATVNAYGADWHAERPMLYAEGEAVQWRYNSEGLLLRRRIEVPIGSTELTITDEIENIGPAPVPHEILYHFNVGYPLLGPGSTLRLGDRPIWAVERFPDAPDATTEVGCLPRTGSDADSIAHVTGTLAGRAVSLDFACSASLGHLQFYKDLRPRVGLLAIEPCSTPRGREPGGRAPLLQPGETRRYAITVTCRDV